MGSRKIATTVYITVDQDRKLKLLSQAMGKPVAQLVRHGIDLVIEKHADRLPRQLGLGIGTGD